MDAIDQLDSSLPVYVDYLGRYETDPGFVENAADVMKALIERGVDERRFLPNGELTVEEDGGSGRVVVRDEERNVAESFDAANLRDPVAFISSGHHETGSGFSRVVVFTEDYAGHFNRNPVFHAVQVRRCHH